MSTPTTKIEYRKGLHGHSLTCERGDRTLFEALDLSVEPGQTLLVEGSNGSGKTTLLRVLCGLRTPDEGSLHWDGETLERQRDEYRRQLAYLGHSNGIKDELNAGENLRISTTLNSGSESGPDEILNQFGLNDYMDIPARHLSAGQKRRLALARVMSSNARLWLLDEPFTALDRQAVIDFSAMMVAHTGKGGMIVVTAHHDLQLGDADVQRLDLSA